MSDLKQTIRYCTTTDGVSIAWSTMGTGPPLVHCSMWGHLEHELRGDNRAPIWAELSRSFTLIRYDGRGSGLSERSIAETTREGAIADVEAVVEAAHLGRFALLAFVSGAPTAISYAARHPERVTHLVVYGGMARGLLKRNPTADQLAQRASILTALPAGWADPNPAFRMLNAYGILPDATRNELEAAAEFMRIAFSGPMFVSFMTAQGSAEVSEEARQIRCPALVLHARGDARVPFEEGRRLASLIPDARFVPIDGRNSLPLDSQPTFADTMREIRDFLLAGQSPAGKTGAFADLTPREHEVLELIAQGRDNLQIAAHLGLSEKTVRNHITPIFDKLAVENRSQAIVKAREAGLGTPKRAS